MPSDQLQRFLKPDSLVPIGGEIAKEAHQVVRGCSADRQKARALYDHILATMRYDKSGAGWGHGDAVFACDARRGNCTDIHSLLIAMARAVDIPARFVIGFPLPEGQMSGEISGYHCWAELFIEKEGWVPVDASEAIKHPQMADYYFGSLDAHRIAFTTGRDILLREKKEYARANYLIYPFVLVDGRPYSDVSHHLHFRLLNADEKSR